MDGCTNFKFGKRTGCFNAPVGQRREGFPNVKIQAFVHEEPRPPENPSRRCQTGGGRRLALKFRDVAHDWFLRTKRCIFLF
jgi:hypothetical protein